MLREMRAWKNLMRLKEKSALEEEKAAEREREKRRSLDYPESKVDHRRLLELAGKIV